MRHASMVAICASIAATIRLARDSVSTSSPRLIAAAVGRVGLARAILKRATLSRG